jgi:ferredoxin
MKALTNFKICDNAPECGGISVCPNKAMYYDEEKRTIIVDADKCTCCGLCEKECPIGAIMVPKSAEQCQEYQKKIEDDPRTIKHLFVDRYEAVALSEYFKITSKQLDERINCKGLTLIEVFSSETAECLLKSIPIKDITDSIEEAVTFYKIDVAEDELTKYDIKELPSLLFFRDGNFLGKIEGYYDIDQKAEFEEKIKNIINK